MNMLDRVFRELVKGKREPFLQDYPNQVTVGYQFDGKGRKLPLAILTRRARTVFACQTVRDPRRPRMFYPLRAAIDCTYRKQGRQVRSGDITARLQLEHMLNLCFFQFTKGLEGLEVAPAAQESMDSLEQTLAATSGEEAVEYMRSITE